MLNDAGETPLTGREIQRRAGLSNRATMLALDQLFDASVVLCDTTPSAHFFRPNPRNYLWTKAVRPALEAEEAFWEDLRKTVRRHVSPRPEAAMVTGALVRDERAESGKLDLHLLFEGGRQRLQAYRCVERLSERVRERHALEISCTFMDMRTMDDPEYRDLWRRIAREGVLLFGKLP